MTDFVHPGLLFIAGALPIPFLAGRIRTAIVRNTDSYPGNGSE